MRTRYRAGLSMIAVAALALSACGDDDDDDAADDTAPATATPTTDGAVTTTSVATPPTTDATTTTEGTTTETTAATGAGSDEFCTTVVEAEAVATAGPDVDFETATEEEVTAAMEEFSAALLPMLDQLAENVPDEVASDLETIDSAFRTSMETGDDPFSQPGFAEADRSIDQYIADNCGFDVYAVRAVEYEFEDVPTEIETGIVGFELQNEGREGHELVLFRINDDVDLTLEELAELPEEESQSMVEFVTAAFAEPGGSDFTFNDLRPGRYGILCFIPVGTTDMSMLEGGPEEATGDAAATTTEATGQTTDTTADATTGDATTGGAGEMGPPHFTQGMMAEFEVVEAGSGGGSTSPSTTDGSDSSAPSTTEESDSATTTTNGSDTSPSTTTG